MKFLLIILTISATLYGVMIENKSLHDQLATDLNKEFKDDFNIWGVEFDKKSLTIKFDKNYIAKNSSNGELQRSFEIILKDFYPRYLKYLLQYKKDIKVVKILGYTSSRNDRGETKYDKYMRNLILSQENVDAVLSYIHRLPDEVIIQNRKWINKNIVAVGRSSSDLIFNKFNQEDEKKSKRVEFKIILKKIFISDKENVKVEPKKEEPKIISDKIEFENKNVLLSKYIQRLLLENPTLNQQQQLINSLEADINIAKTVFNPTLSYSVKYSKYSESTADDKENSLEKDVTIKYNIFNKFIDTIDQKIKEYNYEATKFTKNQKELELIYSTVEAFINLKKQYHIIELSKINIEDYDRWLAKEDIKFQNGLTTLRDFAKTKSRYITKKMNYEEIKKVYEDNIATMQKYIDFDIKNIIYFEDLNIESGYFDNKNLAQDDMVIYSPYIQEAILNIEMYKEKTNRAKVTFYPTIDLTATKRQFNDNFKDRSSSSDDRSIKIEAKIDIYSGGKDQADYNKKVFEFREKILTKDEVLRSIQYKIDLDYNKYKLMTIKKTYLVDLIEQREESFIGANYDYKFAKIDANGLLDAVDDLYNAKKLYIENKYDLLLSKYKILTDIGTIKDDILYE